jgi:hypothetical protein
MPTLIILYLISWSMLMITVLRQLPQIVYRWIKIITAILFVSIGIFNDQPMIIVTIALFFIGDVLLAFANGGQVKRWLIWGMLFFWLGHIGLIFCMLSHQGFSYLSLILGFALVILIIIINKIFSALDFRGMYPVILLYGYTLGILGSLAILNYSIIPLLALGIIIFILSDISLIFWYFYPSCPRIVKLINVITYFGAVLLIALS